mgnify:CR=1 FL=1
MISPAARAGTVALVGKVHLYGSLALENPMQAYALAFAHDEKRNPRDVQVFRIFHWAVDAAQTALADEWIRDRLRARNVGLTKALVDSDKASDSDYTGKMVAIAVGKYAVPAAASSSSTAICHQECVA